MVALVRAVSFIVMLALTEMWLKPNRDGPSGVKKHDSSYNILQTNTLKHFTRGMNCVLDL